MLRHWYIRCKSSLGLWDLFIIVRVKVTLLSDETEFIASWCFFNPPLGGCQCNHQHRHYGLVVNWTSRSIAVNDEQTSWSRKFAVFSFLLPQMTWIVRLSAESRCCRNGTKGVSPVPWSDCRSWPFRDSTATDGHRLLIHAIVFHLNDALARASSRSIGRNFSGIWHFVPALNALVLRHHVRVNV